MTDPTPIKPWPKPEVKYSRRPKSVARLVLLDHGLAHFEATGKLISLNKVCGLVEKTTGYGYQLYSGGLSKPGVEWRRDLMLSIVLRDWFDHQGQIIPSRVVEAVQQDWQHEPRVARALAAQIRDAETAFQAPGVADQSLGPDLADIVWSYTKKLLAELAGTNRRTP